jgi:hypothetical protein
MASNPDPRYAAFDIDALSHEEISEDVQECYANFRQRVGDYNMDSHSWEWKRDRLDALATWLERLATAVRTEAARER